MKNETFTPERIKAEADTFFEWDGEDRSLVTTTSCLLFAQHIAGLMQARSAQPAPVVPEGELAQAVLETILGWAAEDWSWHFEQYPDLAERVRSQLVPTRAGVDAMVGRFLSWPLPADVCADPCASMPGYPHRSGTSLLNAEQAKAMFLHVLASSPAPAQTEPVVPEGFKALLDRIVPRLDAGGPNPIDPEIHHCEWTLYQERERIHAEFAAAPAPVPHEGLACAVLETILDWTAEDWSWHFEQYPDLASRVRSQLMPAPVGVDAMVNRFLSWPLPADVYADPCASMPNYPHRFGTNLLNAEQAKAMLLHVLTAAPAQGHQVECQECERLRAMLTDWEADANLLEKERDEARAELSALKAQQVEQHPDDEAVDRFAVAMKAKLAKSREKGRHGWQTASAAHLSGLLYHHMYKADPLDVANLAMMLHQNGKAIELPHEARHDKGEVQRLREALEWYAEKAKQCRKIGADGDNARQALDLDGGFRALDALAASTGQEVKP